MIYRFDQFEIHEERCELRRGDERIAIPRKSFDLLLHLVRNAGRVVTKDELFTALWPGEFVSDAVLPVHVCTVRKALGEPEGSEIVRTVRGRGYSVSCDVEWVQPAPAAVRSAQLARGPFVGRAALMEQLRGQFAAAAAGAGGAVLLYGDAGIGKTRVLEEFARYARGEQAIVLEARPEPDGGAPPFWTLVELLRAAGAALRSEAMAPLLAQHGFDVRRAEQRLERLLAPVAESGAAAESTRFRLAQTAVALATRIARMAPLVIAIDDLHALEEGTLRVWTALVRQLRQHRILALGAYREGDLGAGHRLSAALGALATEPGVVQLQVRGLEPPALEELLAAELSCQPPAAFLRSVHEATEGNPFFVRELLRLLAAEGSFEGREDWDISRVGLPRASREAIERRLQAVGPECNALLAWAAVIGRRFALPLLAQVARHSPEDALERLREAAQAGILAREPAPGESAAAVGEYRFAHGLFREAIYTRLSAPERVLRHRAVGMALERLLAGPPQAELGELAHHFFEAAPGGDIDRATDYCARAARQALAAFAYPEAVRHLEHALRAEELRDPPDLLRFCCVTLALGDARRRAGRQEEAQAAFAQSAQYARQLGRADLLACAALGRARWPQFVGPRPSFGSEPRPGQLQQAELLAQLEEALAALCATDPPQPALEARLLAAAARAQGARGQRSRAAELAQAACARAAATDELRVRFDVLAAQRAGLALPAEASAALQASSQLVELADNGRSPALLFAAYASRVPALFALGELPGADRDIRAAHELAVRLHAPELEYTVARFELARALGDGRMRAVRPLLQRLRALGWEAGDPHATWKYQLLQLWVLYAEGRSALVRGAIETTEREGHVQSVAAHIFHADYWRGIGERGRAAEHFERAAAQPFEALERDDEWLWTLTTCALVCADLGDRHRAAPLYELIAPCAELNVMSSMHTYRGSAHLPLARLALVLEEKRRAWLHFEQALAFNQRIGSRTALVLTQAHYGRALAAGSTGERERSRSLLETVARESDALGVTRLRRASDPRAEI